MTINALKPRVLIVDDERRNIRMLEAMLQSEPYQLVSAQSGPEALAILEHDPADLILLDVMMPQTNGFEVCRKIKSDPAYQMIPVVMVTVLSDVKDRVMAMQAGADDFLSKPVDATELIVRVRSLMRIRQLYHEKETLIAERLRFMAGVAHNIKSPLTALVLNVDRLGSHASPDDETAAKVLQRMKAAVEHIERLADSLMDYYQIESGQFRLEYSQCCLMDLVEEAADVAIPLAEERDITLRIEPAPDLSFEADRHSIVQIVLNLLTNAIKYTDPGGAVTLRFYPLAEADYTLPSLHYPPVLTLPPDGLVVEVEDTGRGIAAEDFHRVFKEFERLGNHDPRKTTGVGLGLPVSQRVIRMHGGELWFTSELGRGSVFAFFLPLVASSSRCPGEASVPKVAAHHANHSLD